MSQLPRQLPYQAQLLRIWVESPQSHHPVWRFSLEDVATGQRTGFADLDALICHLLGLMEALTPPVADE